MRIRRLKINHWRHFENIDLQLGDDASLVCLVGANGTGKSNLLELIAACAHRLGLSIGIDIPRGNPFEDQHDFSLEFYIAEGVNHMIDQELIKDSSFPSWDRTLIIESYFISSTNYFTTIKAGGIADPTQNHEYAQRVTQVLRAASDVYFLSLDANRAYPKKNISPHEVGQAYDIDWEKVEFTRGRSFVSSTALYDEWMKYFLSRESQSNNRQAQEIRRARQAQKDEPMYIDQFDDYREALQKILPHLAFTGVDLTKRTLLFDTTGFELSFDQLSGGEREIAFLIGQIDRFGLRKGLFLLDEPELHLNSDLIRTWVVYLASTVQTGQIWLATHSLEAVEAAGQQATFILERNEETRKVDSAARLDTRPVLSALSRAVGTPAFSISQIAFVYVEGEAGFGEKERFRKLTESQQHIRFIEGGSGNEVLRRVDTIRTLSSEEESGIRIGGIVDRDFRSTNAVNELTSQNSIFVLPVHEVENFFLHPNTLQQILKQNGQANLDALGIIRNASDARAGSWVFLKTMAMLDEKSLLDLPAMPSSLKHYSKGLSWQKFENDNEVTIQGIVEKSQYKDSSHLQMLKNYLETSVKIYSRKRNEEELWKICEGKEILDAVAPIIGFRDKVAMISAVYIAWKQDEALIPKELIELRKYLETL